MGIVSEGDLLRGEGTSRTRVHHPWWLEAAFVGQTVAYDKARGARAGVVMTRNVITVDEDAPLNEIAELLERHHIKRVPVLRDGKLAGIVSRANLLHGLANTIVDHHEPRAAKDRQLRNELVKMLLAKHELDTALVNVTVTDGNVRLWGIVENARAGRDGRNRGKVFAGRQVARKQSGHYPISGVPI